MSEQVQVLGEIRDQLKRIADILEALTFEGKTSLNVEIGEPTIRIRERDITKVTNAIRGYVEK